MSKLLFRLNGVSNEEANDVRKILIDNSIDFYETSSGNWGVSMSAIWLKDECQFQKARALLDAYQIERIVRVKKEHASLRNEGKHNTTISLIKQNAMGFISYLVMAALVIYFSIRLILDLAQ